MSNFYPPGLEKMKKVIAVDFDGVLHNAYLGWGDGTCYGEPFEDALESIKTIAKSYDIVVFSAKAKPDRPLVNGKTGAMLIREWCIQHGFMEYIHSITCEKPRAELYIDDNGYRFSNWKDTLNFIENEL